MQLTASNVRLVAIVLTALCAVSGGIYLVFCKRKDYRRAFAYKGTAGLCFVVLGLLGGLAIGFVALALSGVYNYRKDTNAGNMQVPGMIYMAVVAFMGALAVSVAIHAPGVSTLLFAIGGVLFIISDNILCAYSFGSERRFGANIGIHATYYAAQLLIAWSIFFM